MYQVKESAPALNAAVTKYAAAFDVPTEGITILGGRPYLNSTGLMHKARKLGISGIKVEIVKSATKEDNSAIVKATVTMKDGSTFDDFGLGSPESIQMKTLHSPDVVTMTTITRAKNRALRAATGFGFVSAEEMKDAHELYGEGNAPSLSLPTPEKALEGTDKEKILPMTAASILAQLQALGKDQDKMLAHYSGVYKRPLEMVSDLTEAEGKEIMAYLASLTPPTAEQEINGLLASEVVEVMPE